MKTKMIHSPASSASPASTTSEPARNLLPEEEVLDCEHVAAWLGVPVTTVRFWARLRRLPAVRIGKRWKFPRRALLAWFEQRAAAHVHG